MNTQKTEIVKHNNSVKNDPLNPPQLPPPALVADPEADRRRAFALESLKRKQRADSFFSSLTDAQQNQLLRWLEEIDDIGAIVARVAAPPPAGLGIRVHYTSLQRFRAHWRSLHYTIRGQEIDDTIHDMETNGDFSQSLRIQKALTHMLHQKLFELARTHPGSDTVTHLLSSIEKLAALDLKRQKLLIEREKCLRSGSSSPKHHRVDLNIVRPAGTVSVSTADAPQLPEAS